METYKKTQQNSSKTPKHHHLWIYTMIVLAISILVFLFIYSKKNKEPDIDREEIVKEIHRVMNQGPQEQISEQEKKDIYNQIQNLRSQQSNEN